MNVKVKYVYPSPFMIIKIVVKAEVPCRHLSTGVDIEVVLIKCSYINSHKLSCKNKDIRSCYISCIVFI